MSVERGSGFAEIYRHGSDFLMCVEYTTLLSAAKPNGRRIQHGGGESVMFMDRYIYLYDGVYKKKRRALGNFISTS